ncbi:MAG TPA: hypothetical protein VIJ49_08485, partial [Aestuariivirga sp.]
NTVMSETPVGGTRRRMAGIGINVKHYFPIKGKNDSPDDLSQCCFASSRQSDFRVGFRWLSAAKL